MKLWFVPKLTVHVVPLELYVPVITVCAAAVVPSLPLPFVATVNVFADVFLEPYKILSIFHLFGVTLVS